MIARVNDCRCDSRGFEPTTVDRARASSDIRDIGQREIYRNDIGVSRCIRHINAHIHIYIYRGGHSSSGAMKRGERRAESKLARRKINKLHGVCVVLT